MPTCQNAVGCAQGGIVKESINEADGSLPRLPQRAFPAPVRRLLEGALNHAATHFEPGLKALLESLDGALFKQAERAASNDEQQHLFESLRALKRSRDDIVPRFLAHLEAGLARLASATPLPVIPASPESSTQRPPRVRLELVDSGDLEVSLALRELAARAELRHGPALQALRYRFGVLGARAALDVETVPFGPAELADALRYAFEPCALALPHRVLAFQLADRQLIAQVGDFYLSLNLWFREQAVLPNLDMRGSSIGSEAAATRSGSSSKQADKSVSPADAVPAKPLVEDEHVVPESARPPSVMSGLASASAHNSNAEMFADLRALLAANRPQASAVPAKSAMTGDTYQASGADLQAVLRNLQSRPAPRASDGQPAASTDLGQLKQNLLGQLRQHSPQGLAPALAQEDSDTIDLVGMLFEYIAKSTSAYTGGSSLLDKLQVPILRTALADKAFFTQPDHPARRLLGSIADAATLWMGEKDADPALVEKVHLLVERVTHEFDGDLGLIQRLVDDLGAHTQQLARRAEIAERRHIEAAKGRDKLGLARQQANSAIARMLARRNPTPIVRAVLEQAWTDVLALTILRHGEDSRAYQRRLAVADQLQHLGSGQNVKVDLALRGEVHSGLLQVGLHEDAVAGVLEQLFDNSDHPEQPPPAAVTVALETRTRLGADAPTSAAPAVAAPVPALLSNAEQKMLLSLRSLPFGTWFDFVINQQGALVRRKLAWFSPVSGRCLFVNARGARADERSMEQLARDLVLGRVRMVEDTPMGLIERAWKAITNSLQRKAQPALDNA